MVDSTLMEKRIKPWINKKIIEYIGEEEQSLVDYICQKVRMMMKIMMEEEDDDNENDDDRRFLFASLEWCLSLK